MATMDEWHAWSFPGGRGWTHWAPITEATLRTVPVQAGAYVLGLPPSRLPKGGLGRLLAADPHGLLDVGESSQLQKRLRLLRACASAEGTRGHMAGWRLGSGGLLAKLEVSVEELRVSWSIAADRSESYRLEGDVLRRYYDLFGELPPLNYKFNWSVSSKTRPEQVDTSRCFIRDTGSTSNEVCAPDLPRSAGDSPA